NREPDTIASTYVGNPACLDADTATIRSLQDEYVANSAKISEFLLDRLERLMDRHPAIADVRGLGLMLGIEIVKDRTTKEKAPELRDAIIYECFRRGLLVLAAGPSTIRLSPPLMVDEEQAQFALDTLSEVIATASN